MNLSMKNFWLLGLISLVSLHLYSQKPADPGSSDFDVVNGLFYAVMSFKDLPGKEQVNELAGRGIRIYDYLGNKDFLVCMSAVPAERSSFTFAKLQVQSRMSPELAEGTLCILDQKSIAEISVQYFPEQDIQQIIADCEQLGCEVKKANGRYRFLQLRIPVNVLERIKTMPWLQYVACTPEAGQPEDREGRALHRVNQVGGPGQKVEQLNGEGVHVLVRDDGPVGPHVDFRNRIINQTFGTNGSHGDGVSGIVCGAANVDPTVEGMAPAARLHVINYQDDFLDNTEELHRLDSVMITNSSYSNGCNGGYTLITQIVDGMAHRNPSLLHCFSAGNSNNLDCGYGAGTQWGNITGGHKIGKNVITTANLMINGIVDNSSSRGPTKDGRMKPEVSARGTNEVSTDINNTYQVFGGTSAASPGVAGTSALLYQSYRRDHNGENPEAALIKSCLMNTASDLGTPGPDYVYGCGVIDALRAYQLLHENRYRKVQVEHNKEYEFEMTVPDHCAAAKFMIYWEESESSINARKVLINDIDMYVITPSGTKVLPLVLNPTPDPVILAAGASPGVDTLNNFEQVIIPFPGPGKYKVVLQGKFLPDQEVGTYLLFDFPGDRLQITSPAGGEQYSTLESTYFYFNSYHNDSIRIDLSTDGGASWKLIKNITGDNRLTNYTIPSNINSDSCLVRLTQGTEVSYSGLFTITNPITGLKIDRYCPDQLRLTWAVSSKDSFIIYKLGDRLMEEYARTDSNFIEIPLNGRTEDLWFAVAGYREGVLGRRTKAIFIPDTLVKCNVKNDLSIRPRNEWLNSREYVSCGNDTRVFPEFFVYNRNINSVSGFSIQYVQNGVTVEQFVNKTLKYRDSTVVKLDQGILLDFDGEAEIPCWIKLNTDEFSYNDTAIIKLRSVHVSDKTGVYPMNEYFDSGKVPDDWIISNEIPRSGWVLEDQMQKSGLKGKVVSFSNTNYSYSGLKLGLYTKTINLAGSVQPYFYMDYAYHKSNQLAGYYDTLSIEIQEVCSGKSLYSVYTGSDNTLYTTGQTEVYPWVPAKSEEWKQFAIDLSAFKGLQVIVRISLTRGVYSNLFLDNIRVIEKLAETPRLALSWEPDAICISNVVRFTGTAEPSGTILNWNFGVNATPKTAVGAGPLGVKYSSGGSKLITLSTKVGDVTVISTKEIQTFQNPLASFDFNILNGKTVRFKNFSTYTRDLNWDFGDGTGSNEAEPLHTFDSSKVYKVTLIVSNPCGSSKLSLDIDLTASNLIETEKSSLTVWPNPAQGNVLFRSENGIRKIQLYDITGRLIETFHTDYTRSELWIEMSTQQSGSYIYKVWTANEVITGKLTLIK